MSLPRTAAVGVILAIVAATATILGEALGLSLQSAALVGVAAGAVVGLVADGGLAARALGFVGGLATALVGYAVTAAVLPDTVSGRAVGLALTLALATVVVLVTVGRLPFWSVLVGVGAFAGVFHASFAASPASILTDGPVAATSVLLSASIGFAVTLLASGSPARVRPEPSRPDTSSIDRESSADELIHEGLGLLDRNKELV